MSRKIFIIATMLVALIPFLNSCGGDPKEEPAPPTGPVTVDINYFIDDMYEIPKMANITVEYTDKDGKTVSEVVENRIWAKKIIGASVPFTAKIKVIYSKKIDFVIDEDKYTVASGASIHYKTTDNREQLLGSSVSQVLTKDGTELYLSKLIAAPKVLTVEIPAPKKNN